MLRALTRRFGHAATAPALVQRAARHAAGGAATRAAAAAAVSAGHSRGMASMSLGVPLHLLVPKDAPGIFNVKYPESVRIVEVAARDGLQNEKQFLPTQLKIQLVNQLSNTGLKSVEVTSFVSPKWIPQMADAAKVLRGITKEPGVSYPVLTPNEQGFRAALAAGAEEIAVFGAASETFSMKNINCSIDDSLKRFAPVAVLAKQHNVRMRGYVSCVLGCPYEGYVHPRAVARVVKALYDMGCYEVSLGDTIGVGTAGSTLVMLSEVLKVVPKEALAVHFHDTYGQALSNILVALQQGIAVIDSAVGGVGGCPYAKGATGNVATEDVLFMLNGMGIRTGVDMDRLLRVSAFISSALGRDSISNVGKAYFATLPHIKEAIELQTRAQVQALREQIERERAAAALEKAAAAAAAGTGAVEQRPLVAPFVEESTKQPLSPLVHHNESPSPLVARAKA